MFKGPSPVAVPKDLLNPQNQLLAFEARAAATLDQAMRVRNQTVPAPSLEPAGWVIPSGESLG